MKTIIRPDAAFGIALLSLGFALLAHFRGSETTHHADQIAAAVAASGQPAGA